MASFELNLFGGFSARLRSGEALAPLGRKSQILLSFLALRAGEAQTRDKLIGLLWSDRGDAQARGSLRQELSVLRKILRKAGPPPIVIDGERLSFDPVAVVVDVRRFEDLLQSDATADLERAVGLYKGPFLDGLAVRDSACEEWLLHERERLHLLLLGILDRLLARRIKEGALMRATELAETILSHDPLREDTHRQLMELHALQGRRSLALRQYQVCRETLARELGVEPEPETVRLHEEILAGRTAPRPPAAPSRNREPLPAAIAPPTPFVGGGTADAYQYYLMGRSFFLRNVWGKDALEAARRLFEQAIEIDPSYARAYAGLANCDCYRLLLGVPDASFDTVAANSARALELEPDLAEAHAARGLALYTVGQHAAANAVFERAVALGPELFEAHYFYARNCRTQGLHEKAAQLFERSAAINRNDFRALGLLDDEYRALGRLEDSRSAARRCLDRINVEVAAHPDDAYTLAFGSAILAELGERSRAEEWAARASRIDPDDAIVNYNLACAYAALGLLDAAVGRLQATFGCVPINLRVFLEWMQQDTAIDPLRGHPDFLALVGKVEADIAASEAGPQYATRDIGKAVAAVRRAETPEAPAAPVAIVDDRPSVAVLSFENLSGKSEEQYFSDGITEDIIAELSRCHGLIVIARHSSLQYRSRSADVNRIGRELQVQYVVAGSIRTGGGRIRITARLIEITTGRHLWTERYDRSLNDLFDLQDEVAKMLAAALAVRIEAEDLSKAKRKPPESMRAYDYWLRGKKCLDLWTPEANAEARRLFAKAIESDPQYARGYAGLAFTYEWAAYYSAWDAEGSSSHDSARMFADMAVSLDDTDHLPHVTLGWVHHQRGEFEQAQQHFARAAAISPNDADAMMNAAMVLALEGRCDDAIGKARFAIRLNPRHPDWYLAFLGGCLFRAHRYADAAAAWERAPDSVPEVRACLAAACILTGRPQIARRHMEEFLRRFSLHWTGRPGVRRFTGMEFQFEGADTLDRFANALREAGMPE